jgi:hypothetical protein
MKCVLVRGNIERDPEADIAIHTGDNGEFAHGWPDLVGTSFAGYSMEVASRERKCGLEKASV